MKSVLIIVCKSNTDDCSGHRLRIRVHSLWVGVGVCLGVRGFGCVQVWLWGCCVWGCCEGVGCDTWLFLYISCIVLPNVLIVECGIMYVCLCLYMEGLKHMCKLVHFCVVPNFMYMIVKSWVLFTDGRKGEIKMNKTIRARSMVRSVCSGLWRGG